MGPAAARLASTYASLAFGLCLVAFLHGAKAGFLLAAAVAFFGLARLGAGVPYAGPWLMWTAACGAWLLAQRSGGGSFGAIHPSLAPLDAHGGVVRWHVGFNLVLLRMLSYGMDLHWQRVRRPLPPGIGAKPEAAQRVEAARPPSEYSFVAYLAYLLFPPLYLTGPTMTFNAFASYLDRPQAAVSPRGAAAYAARLAGCLLLTEALTHAFYASAVASGGAWRHLGLGPEDLGVVGYWVLNFMWLKFLVVWRVARLFALLAGADPPENMRRCVNNNFDIEGFWKSWHASYNQWLVRYLYVPMGGSRTRAANVWVVFTFVALWHDLEPRLLAWAWLMCAFLLPEMLAKAACSRPSWDRFRATGLYRQLRAGAAAANILMLMAANIVGFVVGLDGLGGFAAELARPEAAPFCGGMMLCFFAAAHIMFELREGEARRAHRLPGAGAGGAPAQLPAVMAGAAAGGIPVAEGKLQLKKEQPLEPAAAALSAAGAAAGGAAGPAAAAKARAAASAGRLHHL